MTTDRTTTSRPSPAGTTWSGGAGRSGVDGQAASVGAEGAPGAGAPDGGPGVAAPDGSLGVAVPDGGLATAAPDGGLGAPGALGSENGSSSGTSATAQPAAMRGRRGAPTIRQVAAVAGVSRATASRVINGGHLVSPQAREAVEAAIAELGFVPNAVARNLAQRRTGSVALVVPEPNARVLADPFFGSVINGLSLSLEAADLQMILVIARPGAGHDRAVRYLTAGRVDGAVITSHHREDHVYRPLLESGLPCVFVGRPLDVAGYHCVDMDNVGGARMATEHLISTGRRRIATVAGPQDMSASLDRVEGWETALRSAGLEADAIEYGDFTVDGGTLAMRRLLTRHPDIDAVFAASDLMASGALAELGAAGRRVPDDVAVFGFDDLGVATSMNPPLSTVVHPVERMAERAGQMIMEMVNGVGLPPERVEFEARLAVRQSA